MLLYGSQDLSIERPIVLFSYLSYLFQEMLREPDGERFNLIFHATILLLIWLYIKRLEPLYPSPTKGTPLIYPCLKTGVLRGGLITFCGKCSSNQLPGKPVRV
jgi:hypothetical protein